VGENVGINGVLESIRADVKWQQSSGYYHGLTKNTQ